MTCPAPNPYLCGVSEFHTQSLTQIIHIRSAPQGSVQKDRQHKNPTDLSESPRIKTSNCRFVCWTAVPSQPLLPLVLTFCVKKCPVLMGPKRLDQF